jgi:hypothetical protein
MFPLLMPTVVLSSVVPTLNDVEAPFVLTQERVLDDLLLTGFDLAYQLLVEGCIEPLLLFSRQVS